MTTLLRTALLDPAWNEKGGGKIKRGVDRHYQVDKVHNLLAAVLQSGKWAPNPECCSVWMWTTVTSLPDALWMMGALGAQYVTHAVWVKGQVVDGQYDTGKKHGGIPIAQKADLVLPDSPGLGQRMRICHELLLFGRIGRVPVPETKDRLPSVIYSPRRQHSRKPDKQYELIERHDGEGNRCEFFARTNRPGWDCWGNQAPPGLSGEE